MPVSQIVSWHYYTFENVEAFAEGDQIVTAIYLRAPQRERMCENRVATRGNRCAEAEALRLQRGEYHIVLGAIRKRKCMNRDIKIFPDCLGRISHFLANPFAVRRLVFVGLAHGKVGMGLGMRLNIDQPRCGHSPPFPPNSGPPARR